MSLSACDVLLNLVPALQVEILVRWLHLHDVVKLDSALCSTKHREIFSAILGEEYCVFHNIIKDQDVRYVEWVVLRSVKVSSVQMTRSTLCPAARMKLFQTTGKYLRRLVASCVSYVNMRDVQNDLSTMCPNLEELVFSRKDLKRNDICDVIKHLPRLKHLDLSRCFNATCVMLANIISSALHVISLSACRMVKDALPEVQALGENHTIHTVSTLQCPQLELCLPFIYHCKALTMLYVNGIQRAEVFTILTQCPALTTLSFGVERSHVNNPFSDGELHTLISLIQNLHVLHLYHESKNLWLEGQIETLIQRAPLLHAFFTAHTPVRIAETIAQSIADVHRLTEVSSVSCKILNDYTHELHTLLVHDISNNELQSILGTCPRLVSLTILQSGLLNVDSLDLLNMIGQSTIRILDVRDCELLKSSDVLPLNNLVSLSLEEFTELKQCDVVQLLRQNPNLRKLTLRGCEKLDKETLLHIVEMCNVLEELRFSNLCAAAKFMNDTDLTIDSTLIEELIKLHRPGIKLSVDLRR